MEKQINNENDLQTFFVKVQEPIKKSRVKEFIYTSLNLKGIKLNKKDRVVYIYIPQLNSYEIIVYKKKFHDFILMNSYFYKMGFSELALLICSDFIMLFKDKKLLYLQKVQYTLSVEELQELIYNKLFLMVERFEVVEASKIKNLNKEKSLFLKNLNYLKKNNYKAMTAFLVYSFFVFSLISFYTYKNNFSKATFNEAVKKKEIELQKLIQNKQKQMQVISLISLFENVKKLSLVLTQLSYEQQVYSLILQSNKQKSLYDFMALYKKSLKVEKLQYLPKREKYELHLQIRDY